MKFNLKISGGMGIPIQGSLDTADFPVELAKRLERLFADNRLSHACQDDATSQQADSQSYEFTLIPQQESQAPKTYRLRETQLPDSILELMDEVSHELTRKLFQ